MMSERRRHIRRWIIGLLLLGALLPFVFHRALSHQPHDQASARNCQVCQLGKTVILQPAIQVDTGPPSAIEPNPPGEEISRPAGPTCHSEFSRAPPA